MSITQLLITILTFISPSSGSTVTDLCDVVDTATGVPVWCQPHPDGAPVLDKKVCCSADACVLAGTSCPSSSLFYCDFGQIQADDTIDRPHSKISVAYMVYPAARYRSANDLTSAAMADHASAST